MRHAWNGGGDEVEDYSARVNGVQLHYSELGDPSAPLAVVLHGLTGHRREWEPLTRQLANDFRVLALDQRGHGESEWSDDYTLPAFVDDALSIFEHLVDQPAHLVGHSIGGLVAMLIAARRPELVADLVMVDVGPESLRSEWGRVELPEALEEMAAARYESIDEAVAERLAVDPLAREEHLRRYVAHALTARDGELGWTFDATGLAAFPASVDPDELWRAADAIEAPTLIVRGVASRVLSPPDARELCEHLSEAHFVEIPNGAHDLGVQQPEIVAHAVEAFVCCGSAARRSRWDGLGARASCHA